MGDLDSKDLDKSQISDLIETMKQRDNVTKLMKQLRNQMPKVYEALVQERDEYMAKGINGEDSSQVMVAVCGIAHLEGMERVLKEEGWSAVDYCKKYI
jgi:pheromone shutdown protein TraB